MSTNASTKASARQGSDSQAPDLIVVEVDGGQRALRFRFAPGGRRADQASTKSPNVRLAATWSSWQPCVQSMAAR